MPACYSSSDPLFLARSAERNRAAGLTGLLLHQDDSFLGVLEGPRRVLLARMERIITDPRHARVDIRLEASAAARQAAEAFVSNLRRLR